MPLTLALLKYRVWMNFIFYEAPELLWLSQVSPSPLTLGDGLDLVGLSLGGSLDGGDEFALLTFNFLLLNVDEFSPFHNLDLNLLTADQLFDLGCFEFIGQFSFGFL